MNMSRKSPVGWKQVELCMYCSSRKPKLSFCCPCGRAYRTMQLYPQGLCGHWSRHIYIYIEHFFIRLGEARRKPTEINSPFQFCPNMVPLTPWVNINASWLILLLFGILSQQKSATQVVAQLYSLHVGQSWELERWSFFSCVVYFQLMQVISQALSLLRGEHPRSASNPPANTLCSIIYSPPGVFFFNIPVPMLVGHTRRHYQEVGPY